MLPLLEFVVRSYSMFLRVHALPGGDFDMQDILWIAVTIGFFALSIAYVHFCERVKYGRDMSLESIIVLVISALTTVYLVYALLRPEDF